MKKRSSFITLILITILLLNTSMPAAHAAGASRPYDLPGLSIIYGVMDRESRQLFLDLYDAVRSTDATVTIPNSMSADNAWCVLNILQNECPELCALDRDNVMLRSTTSGGRLVSQWFDLQYKRTKAQQDQFIRDVSALAASFRSSDEETGIRAIYSYLCRAIRYGGSMPDNQFIYSALKTGSGVCNAYAQGLTMLCHFAGYRCSFISGVAWSSRTASYENHAWNIIGVGQQYTLVDATWDDGDNGRDGEGPLLWFGLGDARMYAYRYADAQNIFYAKLPACTDLYAVARSESDVTSMLLDGKAAKADTILIPMSAELFRSLFAADTSRFFNLAAQNGITSSSYSWSEDGNAVWLYGCTYTDVTRFETDSELKSILRNAVYAGTASLDLVTSPANLRRLMADGGAALKSILNNCRISCDIYYSTENGTLSLLNMYSY